MTSASFAEAQARLAARRHTESIPTAAPNLSTSSARLSLLPTHILHYALALTSSTSLSTSPLRVGQLDAELFDAELISLLRGQVADALRYLRGGRAFDDWSAEIDLALRAALFKLTVWDHDATYGAALLGLRFVDGTSKALSSPTRRQKALYGIVTIFGAYAWIRWEGWLRDRDRIDEMEAAGATGMWLPSRLLRHLTKATTTVYAAAAFISFLVFLLHGRYRTLLERALGMRLAPKGANARREVSFEYQNRQLVWHAFTEFLLFILPLLGISRWRRWLTRIWRRTRTVLRGAIAAGGSLSDQDSFVAKGELSCLPERTCAICYQDRSAANAASTSEADMLALGTSGGVVGSVETDVTNPYEAVPCGCVYCFACIATTLDAEADEGWPCLRCGSLVRKCRPWSGDVVEETPTLSSGDDGTSDSGPNDDTFLDDVSENEKSRDQFSSPIN